MMFLFCLTETVIREAENCCVCGIPTNDDSDSTAATDSAAVSVSEPPVKKFRLFASYDWRRTGATGPTSATVTIRGAVLKYMELVEQQLALSSGEDDPWATLKADSTVQMLQPLLEKVLFSVLILTVLILQWNCLMHCDWQ